MARRKKNEDEPIENKDKINNESDETFGLPEVEYEPLRRDVPPVDPEPVVQPEPTPEFIPVEEPVNQIEEPTKYVIREEVTYQEENEIIPPDDDNNDYNGGYHYVEEKPVWPKVLGILLLILLAGGAIYYFAVYKPDQQALRERELLDRAAAEKEAIRKREAARIAELNQQAEQRKLDSLANIPKEGTMEVLSGRTGQYYVVVASAVDDDLLVDYGSKLVKEGRVVKIIPPFGKTGKFYRLAIEAKDSYADAQATADGMKGGAFGDQLWVVRY